MNTSIINKSNRVGNRYCIDSSGYKREHAAKKHIASSLYVFFAATSLIMFYYAHAEWLPVEKAFYVPCAITLLCSFFVKSKWDNIDRILAVFVVFVALSDVLTGIYPKGISSPLIRISLGVFCFNKIRKVDLYHTITVIAKLSPAIMVTYYVFANPLTYVGWVRYGGFSGDPNYLAISLELLIVLNMIFIHRKETGMFWRVLSIASIIATLPLFLVGQSRMGLISLAVLFLFYLIFLYKKSKRSFMVLAVAGSALLVAGYGSYSYMLDGVERRFTKHISSRSSGGLIQNDPRVGQIKATFRVFERNPSYVFSGIGADHNPEEIQDYKQIADNPVHNTFFGILLQEGIFALSAFLVLLVVTFRQIVQRPDKSLYLGLYLSLLLNISSVPSTSYLTFWWSLFFLHNPGNYISGNTFRLSGNNIRSIK